MLARNTIALTIQTFLGKAMPLLFNMLSRLVIAFLSRKQTSFNFMAAVTICSDFEAQENKICHCLYISPSICHEVIGLDTLIFGFFLVEFQASFLLSFFHLIKRLSSSSIPTNRVLSSAYPRLLLFLPVNMDITRW